MARDQRQRPGGPNGTEQDFAFTPVNQGNYTVTFTVTDNHGDSNSATYTLTVDNTPPENVSAGPDRTVNEGDTVQLHGSYTDLGTLDTHAYLWQVSSDNGQVVAGGASQDFSFIPDRPGRYTVTFTVTDDSGESNSAQVVITSANVAP